MEILIAIAILGGLGLLFGLVLSAASKIFYVETDPRLDALNEALPGANCGGCGYAGCGGYAEAVLNGEAEIGKCASGGDECAQAMGPLPPTLVAARQSWKPSYSAFSLAPSALPSASTPR